MWKSLLLSIFLTVLDQTAGKVMACGFMGECMYYSTDYVLHNTKSVIHMDQCCLCNDLSVMYIWINMDKYSGSPLLRNSYKKLLGSTFWKTY